MTERKRRLPGHLSAGAKRWLRAVHDEWELSLIESLLMECAADCWEQVQTARKTLDEVGQTYLDRNGIPRAHPAAAIMRDEVICFLRLIKQVGFDAGEEQEEYGGFPRIVEKQSSRVYENAAQKQRAYRLRSTGQVSQRGGKSDA